MVNASEMGGTTKAVIQLPTGAGTGVDDEVSRVTSPGERLKVGYPASGRIHNRLGGRTRRGLLLGALLFATAGAFPAAAAAVTPSVVNTSSTGGQTNWLESFATTGENGDNASGHQVRLSVLVKHDPGRKVTGLKIDEDYNGTDEASSATTRPVTAQQPTIVNGYDYSRVTYQYSLSTTGTGFSCGIFSGTRRTVKPLRIRAVLDDGVQTPTTTSDIKFTNAGQCTGQEDYAYLYQWAQTATSITPGQSVTFTYRGDDPDTNGSSDFNGIRWRMRRLSDGATTTPQTSCPDNGDNADKTLATSFPNRGRWVVEAELLDAGGCGDNQNPGYWFWIGAVDVNSPSSASPNVSLSATRPQINGNTTVSATVDDSDDAGAGGVAQDLEWDLDGNTANGVNGFETSNLGDWLTGLTAAQKQRTIGTVGQAPGLHTVRVRVGDNGALGGADNIRRTNIGTTTYLVDSPPVATPQGLSTETGQALPITLAGTDPDNDPLTFTITSAPSNGTLTGSGASRTYTSNPGFAGNDSFTFQAADGFGGLSTATVTIQVAPQTVITSAPSGTINSRGAMFAFTSPVSGATFECSLDTAAFAACSSPVSVSELADGPHTFRVSAIAASLTDPTPASTTFIVDAFPAVNIDSGPSGASTQTDATFTFSTSEQGSAAIPTTECSLDGGSFRPCESPKTYTDLPDGPHSFEVRATDASGKQTTSAPQAFAIDTTPPNTTIDSAPSGRTTSDAATISFTADEGGAFFECSLDGAVFTGCSSPQTLSGLSDGAHTFRVRATDALGNVEATPDTATWIVDTTAPDTTIVSGPPAQTSNPTPTFGFDSSDPSAVFECRLDSSAPADFAPCSSPFTTAALADGPHTLDVRAVDDLGNRDSTPASRTFTVDTQAPTTTIDSGPTGSTNSFTFSSSEPGSGFECRIDGGSFRPCSSPYSAGGLGDGFHTFEVRAIDVAGNRNANGASRTFTVDTTAPQTTISFGPAPIETSTEATFALSSDDPSATFECSLDGSSFSACATPRTYTGLAPGSHTFAAQAKDGAGNIDPTPATRAWTIDTGAKPPPNGQPVIPPPPGPAACTFASAQANCGNPSMRAKLTTEPRRGASNLFVVADSGGSSLGAVTLRLPRQLLVRASRRALRKPAGSLKLSGDGVARTLALRVPKRAAGTLVLYNRGGIKVSLAGRRGARLAITGLPDKVTGLKLALSGRRTSLITTKTKCKTLIFAASFTDRAGNKANAKALADTSCRKRGAGK